MCNEMVAVESRPFFHMFATYKHQYQSIALSRKELLNRVNTINVSISPAYHEYYAKCGAAYAFLVTTTVL